MTETDTLELAKNELRQNWKEGVKCQCCGQFVKVYRRKLTSTQAAGLIRLVKLYLHDGEYHHVSEIKVSGTGGEFAQLRRWELIEQEVNEDSKKRTSGMWKPTPKGVEFVMNKIDVPGYCETYNNKTLEFSEEETNVMQALGTKFDYAELMGKLL